MSPAGRRVAVVGAGPAGLMAAQTLLEQGLRVEVYDAMPSAGRKFLLAGRGGLNLTHSEPAAPFLSRYGNRAPRIAPWLEAFGAADVRAWSHGLGIDTFVGSSGRVFPREMKAAPLLRAWLARGRRAGRTALRRPAGRARRAGRRGSAGAGRRKLGAPGVGRGLGA